MMCFSHGNGGDCCAAILLLLLSTPSLPSATPFYIHWVCQMQFIFHSLPSPLIIISRTFCLPAPQEEAAAAAYITLSLLLLLLL
jgi:hypothetical protein